MAQDINLSSELRDRALNMHASARMLDQEATELERLADRIDGLQGKNPGQQTGTLLTDTEVMKVKAGSARKLAAAMASA